MQTSFLGDTVDNDPYLSVDIYCYTLSSIDVALYGFDIYLIILIFVMSFLESSHYSKVATTTGFVVGITP